MFLNNQAKSSRGKRGNGEHGQAAVELVLATPFLLLVLFLAIDFGWLLKNSLVITNASREAARCAALNAVKSCRVDGDPEAVIVDRLRRGLGVNNLTSIFSGNPTYDIHYIDIDGNGVIEARKDSVVVCILANNKYISPVLPFLSMVTRGGALPNPFPLKARTEMRLQEEPPSPLVPTDWSEDQACDFS
jgi:hypothetical protein